MANNYNPLATVNMQGGLDVSSAPLSQASQNALGDGSWNAIVSGNGYVKPWGGATSQGADSGSYKMMPFGNTWGGIKAYQNAGTQFEAGTAAVQTDYLVLPDHGWVTGVAVDLDPFNPPGDALPTGLSAAITYYVIVLSVDNVSFALSLADALDGTAVSITAGTGSGDCSVAPTSSASVPGSGNWMQDIGMSRWGIGSGQPMIAGVAVSGFRLTTNLQVQIPDPATGLFTDAPVEAGLGQPSAPGLGIVDTVGTISNSMSAKVARSRPSTGAVSVASPTSAVVNPQANQLRVTFPAASAGQTHWRVYFTQQGFGGTGIHYLAEYAAGLTDIPEATVAAGSAAASRATGTIQIATNPAAFDTVTVNGEAFIFVTVVVTPAVDVLIGVDASATAANLAALLNASVDVGVDDATYTVVTDTVTVTHDTAGSGGNAFTLATSVPAKVTLSGGTLTGGVDGVARSLVFNFKDGDLVPLEASYDDYAPPAATHAIRLNTVMNLPGCYSGSTTGLVQGDAGTAIAVSKENNYEAYVPTSLLYLPEQVTDTLARPLDDYGYVGCKNSVHALQYVGSRGDELPSCTITTVLPDIGVQYPHNWCSFQGRLLLMPAPGVLLLMNEDGGFDATFANPVTHILRTFALASTAVGYDPSNDSIVVMNGRIMLVYSRQAGIWRAIWLPDFGSVKASGRYVFAANPADSSTFAINGVTFTFKDTPGGGTDIQRDPTTLATSIANAVTVLNASVDPLVSVATYSTPGGGELLIVHDTGGTAGNAFSLGSSTGNITRSAATLTGGAAGVDGTCLASCTTSGGVMYFSMTNSTVETAYTYDTGGATAPISFVCNPQNAGGVVVNDVYEMAVAAWTTVSTRLGVAINKNLTQTAYRRVITTAGSATITCDASEDFTSDMATLSKKVIIFGPNLAGYGTVLARGTVVTYNSAQSIVLDTPMTASLTDCLMFVGEFTSSSAISRATHLPNFFPNMPELRSFQVATWMQATGSVGNVLTVDLLGATYASSRAQ